VNDRTLASLIAAPFWAITDWLFGYSRERRRREQAEDRERMVEESRRNYVEQEEFRQALSEKLSQHWRDAGLERQRRQANPFLGRATAYQSALKNHQQLELQKHLSQLSQLQYQQQNPGRLSRGLGALGSAFLPGLGGAGLGALGSIFGNRR